jgi:hypothetical protein
MRRAAAARTLFSVARVCRNRNGSFISGAVIGVVMRLFLRTALRGFIASFLFGASTLVFTTIPVLLTGVAMLAVWVPAQRASRVDPLIALRSQSSLALALSRARPSLVAPAALEEWSRLILNRSNSASRWISSTTNRLCIAPV